MGKVSPDTVVVTHMVCMERGNGKPPPYSLNVRRPPTSDVHVTRTPYTPKPPPSTVDLREPHNTHEYTYIPERTTTPQNILTREGTTRSWNSLLTLGDGRDEWESLDLHINVTFTTWKSIPRDRYPWSRGLLVLGWKILESLWDNNSFGQEKGIGPGCDQYRLRRRHTGCTCR